MANPPLFIFQRGEPVVLGRKVLSGDPTGYTVQADVKATTKQFVPPEADPIASSFVVSFVAATGEVEAHWLLTIALGLPVGLYCTDVKYSFGGSVVEISAPAFIQVVESVTG